MEKRSAIGDPRSVGPRAVVGPGGHSRAPEMCPGISGHRIFSERSYGSEGHNECGVGERRPQRISHRNPKLGREPAADGDSSRERRRARGTGKTMGG